MLQQREKLAWCESSYHEVSSYQEIQDAEQGMRRAGTQAIEEISSP